MLKSFTTAIVFAALMTPSIASFAQTAQPVSRAQVAADLVRLEKAGYDPRDWIHYPENIEAAEARVAAEDAAQQTAASSNADTVKSASSFQRGNPGF